MEARDLYGLPLERFTAERNALAKQLRASGSRDEAKAVAALRKPSAAAWAVNQLVRTQTREVSALFECGDAVQRAQGALLARRGDGAALRDALEQERAAVERLTAAARGLLSTEGHELSPAMLERVADTLHAAALEPEARREVKDGCLERGLRHVGLTTAGVGADPARAKSTRAKASPSASALRQRVAAAAQAAERAARELESAEDRAAAAAEELAAAKAAVAAARQRRREAEAAHRRAQREPGSR